MQGVMPAAPSRPVRPGEDYHRSTRSEVLRDIYLPDDHYRLVLSIINRPLLVEHKLDIIDFIRSQKMQMMKALLKRSHHFLPVSTLSSSERKLLFTVLDLESRNFMFDPK